MVGIWELFSVGLFKHRYGVLAPEDHVKDIKAKNDFVCME